MLFLGESNRHTDQSGNHRVWDLHTRISDGSTALASGPNTYDPKYEARTKSLSTGPTIPRVRNMEQRKHIRTIGTLGLMVLVGLEVGSWRQMPK
jgi:hypothetical protein